MHFYAREYSKALGRTITFQDIPVGPWRDGLLERGLPVHLVNHLATMADLHRAGRLLVVPGEIVLRVTERERSALDLDHFGHGFGSGWSSLIQFQ